MTADGAAERLSRIAPNSMTEHRKPEQRDKLRRKKYAPSRNKNNKHSILRRTRTKIPMLVGDTPSPEVCGADKEKSANAD